MNIATSMTLPRYVTLGFLSLSLVFSLGAQQPADSSSDNAPDLFRGSKRLEEEAFKINQEAKELYIIQGRKKDREQAVEIWRRLALMQPKEDSPTLTYAIAQAALNSGEFEAAKRAFVILGELPAAAPSLNPDNLESVVWQSPQASFAVRLVDFTGENNLRSKGSGTVISSDGWILTAAHVVANLEKPGVQFPDGSASEIVLIHPGDFKSDLALVKVNRRVPPPPPIATTEILQGAEIYSISFPSGCMVPVRSKGVFKKRNHLAGETFNSTTLSGLPGSSGGGVYNAKGELVGVISQGAMKQTDTEKVGTCSIVPLEEVAAMLTAWKSTEPFSVEEKEEWKDKSVFWSKRNTKKIDEAFSTLMADQTKGLKLLEEAFESGDTKAGYLLGVFYSGAFSQTEANREKGYDYFDRSSDVMPASQTFRGLLKMRGLGTERDTAGGIKDLELASDRGSALADAHLAWIYFQGKEIQANHQKAMLHAEKAAEAGEPLGISVRMLGLTADLMEFDKDRPMPNGEEIRKGKTDLPRDSYRGEKAIRLFEYCQFASKQDAPMANYLLGMCYLSGLGTERDPLKAIPFYENSAAKGETASAAALGSLYFLGKDVPRDLEKSKYWSEKAADKGDVKMKTLFASAEVMLKSNDPSATLSPKALQYLNDACEANFPNAQELLGIIYLEGKLTSKDLNKSVDLLERAIKNGSTGASAYLPLAKVELEALQKSSK